MDKVYGFPHIPLSHLREMYRHADLLYLEQSMKTKDIWRLMVDSEINAGYAEYYFQEIENARNYKGIEGYSCPLCVYNNGVFIAYCEMHKKIERLEKYIEGIEKQNAETKPTINPREND